MNTISMTKKYQTKDGRAVRLLCTDAPGPRPIVGLVTDGGIPSVYTWSASGLAHASPCGADLVEVKEKAVVHAVMWYRKDIPKDAGAYARPSEDDARTEVRQRNCDGSRYHYWYERIEREVER